MVGYIPNKRKETKEEREFPYEEGDNFDAIGHGSSCPVCEAKWYEDCEPGEPGFYCENTDARGQHYEASCEKCGYQAVIELKAVVASQSWKTEHAELV